MLRVLLAALLLAPAGRALALLPAGTEVLTLTGPVPIEKVKTGDKVLAFSDDKLVQAEVRDLMEKKDRLLKIRTAKGSLLATLEHPLLTRYGFTEARELRKGDSVAVLEDGRRVWTKILSVKPAGVAPVFNLSVAPPHTFIAGGFIVHNYSYSSYGYSGRRRRSYGLFDLIFLAVAGIILFVKQVFDGFITRSRGRSSYRAAEPRSRLVQNGLVNPRADRTLDIMKVLGARDPAFNPVELENFARKVFVKAQAAWQERDYTRMNGLIMPAMLSGLTSKAEALKVRGEKNMMEDVQVLHVDFVHVRCPKEKEGRSFTVLMTASARDYTLNERTNFVKAGSLDPQTFQEYWTFHQLGGAWALARIDQVGEMDFMNAPNLPDTPQAAEGIPLAGTGAQAIPFIAGEEGTRAPSAERAAPADHSAYMPPGMRDRAPAQPERRPQPAAARPADSLPPAAARQAPEQPADHWNRQKMEIAATLAFESVYEAWGSNDSSRLNPDFVSAEALAKLRRLMDERRSEGISFEFKSLFARRAEVVLTRQAASSKLHLDEFTARINATAVRALLRNGKPLRREESPEPFTEYWVFGRQDKAWKLRDILPRMDQAGEDRARDGAPSPVQIEWYWSA